MDGIMAMEGNGPRSGKPKKLGVLLLSSDPVAMDAIACKIINLDPIFVPTSKPGEMAGLGTYHYENIEVIGEDVEAFIDKNFEVVRKPPITTSSGRVRTFLRNQICPKPTIDKIICTNCGTCVIHCPVNPKAVNWHTGDESIPPTYKYDSCIRCYCCQELCPEGAVSVRETILSRAFFR
jgi:ferredoxin